ncbi:MAG: hypothetical protein V7K97_09010 [Nostoc sp.]|uniref:hypothetical protein n=1 Tax=Nostoc sp. TaxID=1180 RepID=UPI002FF76703
MIETFLLNSLLLLSQASTHDRKFLDLKNKLEKFGFQVVIELPPRRGAYGLLQEAKKKFGLIQ